MSDKTIIGAESAPETAQEQPKPERPHVIKLNRPWTFEQKEYTEIDLGGLDRMTIRDAIDAQRDLFGQQEVASSLVCETTTSFAMEIAAKASGLPIEFFKLLPIGAGRQVKREVQAYIRVKNRASGAVLRLEKPYIFRGETFQEFDLSPMADMSIMAESAAENAMAREGFVITENSFNYLYACVMAGMATQHPKELFTGLPLYELLNLKEAVNNSDFFA